MMRRRLAPPPLDRVSPDASQDSCEGWTRASPSHMPGSPQPSVMLVSPAAYRSPRVVDFGSPVFDTGTVAMPFRSRSRALDGFSPLPSPANGSPNFLQSLTFSNDCSPNPGLGIERISPCSPYPGFGRFSTTPEAQRIPGHVWFNFKVNTNIPITPYSAVYGQHPRLFNFDATGAMRPTSPVQANGSTIGILCDALAENQLSSPEGAAAGNLDPKLLSSDASLRPGDAAGGVRLRPPPSSPQLLSPSRPYRPGTPAANPAPMSPLISSWSPPSLHSPTLLQSPATPKLLSPQ